MRIRFVFLLAYVVFERIINQKMCFTGHSIQIELSHTEYILVVFRPDI